MNSPDHSRNHNARPGYQLHDAVDLPGWENRSIWGWDEGIGSFYAQLWRNGSTSDAPEIWLSGATRLYPWPGSIALDIVEHIQAQPLAVVQALAIAHPAPVLRPEQEIVAQYAQFSAAYDPDPFSTSRRHALAWVLGTAPLSPGAHMTWNTKPTPAEVDAEHQVVTGRIYRPEDRDLHSGADDALWWALGR